MDETPRTFSVFADFARHVHSGTDLAEALGRAREAYAAGGAQTVVVFDDATGDRAEVDPRGTEDQLPALFALFGGVAARRPGPGRPRLGVVSREVSLLPRHWDWLGAQPGGASAALRRLVDEARREHRAQDLARTARDAAFKFMSVMGGDRPNFEEAARAVYAGRFEHAVGLIAKWPADLRDHLGRLLCTAARCGAAAGPTPPAS